MPHQCTECGYTFPDGSKEMLSGCPDCGGNKFQYHPGAVPDDAEDGTEESPPDRPDPGVSGAVGRAADTVRDVFGSADEETADARTGEPSAADPATQPAADDTAADPSANADSGTGDDLTADTDTDPVTIEEASGTAGSAETPGETKGDREDPAQADARRQVVDESDLPSPDEVPDREEPTSHPSDTPDIESSDDAIDIPPDSGGSETPPKQDADDDERPELSELREELNSQFESIRIVEPGQYELNLMELYDRDQYIIALQEDGRYVIEVPEAWRDE